MVSAPFPSQICTHLLLDVIFFQSSLVGERSDEGIIERASHVELSGGRLPLFKSSENRRQIQGMFFSAKILAGFDALTLS